MTDRTKPATLHTLTTLAELEATGADWAALHARAGAANPFLAHGWLAAYWRAFGDRRGLRVVCVRAGHRLVAAAPVRLKRRRGVAVLTPLAAELSDYTDVLVDPAVPAAATDLARGLLAVPGWAVLDAPEVPSGVEPGSWRRRGRARRWCCPPRPAWSCRSGRCPSCSPRCRPGTATT